jgi:hypothetical protein
MASALKEVLVVAAAGIAGLAAIYTYQHSGELLPVMKGLISSSQSEPTQGAASSPSPKRSASTNKVTAEHEASPPKSTESPQKSSVIPLDPRPAVSASTSTSNDDFIALRGGTDTSKVTARGDESQSLVSDISNLIEERNSHRWTNSGITLWRKCGKQLRQSKKSLPPADLVEACGHLLADAISTLRTEASNRGSDDVVATAKELRREAAMLSPLQARELDQIISNNTRPTQRQIASTPHSQGSANDRQVQKATERKDGR